MDAAFYFDLASPLAYLAAERILHALPAPIEWQPVLARALPDAEVAFRCETEAEIFRGEATTEAIRAAIERRARALGLQPLRWPADFPFDSALAMRAATYAKSIGRTVPFAQAAFRQAFAGARSLAEPDNVLIAAAACEMHPAAVLKGTELASVRAQLSAATAAATQAGVTEIPAVCIDAHVFAGERALEEAAAHLQQRGRRALDTAPAPAQATEAEARASRDDAQAARERPQ